MTGDKAEERPQRIGKQRLIQELCLMIALNGPTVKEFSQKVHVSEQYLGDVVRERREPGPKILDLLGYRKVILYEIDPAKWDKPPEIR